MHEVLIREISEQIIREQILLNWQFYVLILAVLLIGTIVTTFIVTYIRKRAETYATKTDLDQIIEHLRATTSTAEEIKTTIAHSDWTTREWKTLRRIKLEELLNTIYMMRIWLDREEKACLFNGPKNDDDSPIWKLQVISRLYFPELSLEIKKLSLAYNEYRMRIVQFQHDLCTTGTNAATQLETMKKFIGDETMLLYSNFTSAIGAIEEKAPTLMNQIISA